MNDHLHPIFRDILNSNLKKGVNMKDSQKDMFDFVMSYVECPEDHHIDEIALYSETDDILSEIESLATRIEEGEFDLSYEDMESLANGDRREEE